MCPESNIRWFVALNHQGSPPKLAAHLNNVRETVDGMEPFSVLEFVSMHNLLGMFQQFVSLLSFLIIAVSYSGPAYNHFVVRLFLGINNCAHKSLLCKSQVSAFYFRIQFQLYAWRRQRQRSQRKDK